MAGHTVPNQQLIDHLMEIPNIAAIGVGGSRASGVSDSASDIDLYAFTTGPVPITIRRRIAEELADIGAREIGNVWWGDEDGYAIDGVWYDIVYFDAGWFFGGIGSVINEYRASQGYSTSFVYTLANMKPLHDPDGLIAQGKSGIETYPAQLANAIIELNLPIVADVHASYRNQIARAIELEDAVSVNHRVAGFLASVFDIVFASLGQWHPGEKRQLQHLKQFSDQLPPDFEEHILTTLHHTAPDRLYGLMAAVDRVAADAHEIIKRRKD